jgi:lipopolysaccharide transport system ATP-binding protein
MGDVARQGRTIIFVSHNMGAVRSLCEKGVVLQGGEMVFAGEIGSSIETYHKMVANTETRDQATGRKPRGSGFSEVSLLSHSGSTIEQSDPIEISTTLHFADEVAGFTLICLLDDMNQRRVFHLRRDSSEIASGRSWRGTHKLSLRLPALWLEPGLYTLYFKVVFQGQAASSKHISDCFHLDVGGKSCGWNSILSPAAEWRHEEVGTSLPREAALA